MFKYRVTAFCEKSVSNELNPYLQELTHSQMRKRRRQSFALLKTKITTIPSIKEIIEHEKERSATIFTTDDVSQYLKAQNILAIKFGELRKFPIGAQHLFYIRTTSSIATDQEKIKRIIIEEFDGSEGPYPFTYFVAGDPDSRWLPNPLDRNNDWLIQLRKIEEALLKNGIYAEIGIQRMVKLLSEG